MDYHWRSQFHCCRLCEVDYEFVTHLEESSTEVNFILKNLKIENLTSIAGQYSWSPAGSDYNRWQTIPRKTTIDIYRHYFADFVLLGYSPDEVEKFVEASSETEEAPNKWLNLQSRKKLENLASEYLQTNDDYYCSNLELFY